MLEKRASGVLMHISSLPSRFFIGDLGPAAYKFADFLEETGQHYWQVLPLNPTSSGTLHSPYSSSSVFACNPLLISPEKLVEDNLLDPAMLTNAPECRDGVVDFHQAESFKKDIIKAAFARFSSNGNNAEFENYCNTNAWWLADYATYAAIKEQYQGSEWTEWPEDMRNRDTTTIAKVRHVLQDRIQLEKFSQFIFERQWHELSNYCRERSIKIIGDLPIYVNQDSADVWCHRDIFELDQGGKPTMVAGVPPDYFSETGQLWGNPLYRWEHLKGQNFDWWMKRFLRNMQLADIVRIDHFRGFVAYWAVPAGNINAMYGKWIQAPVMDFFNKLRHTHPGLEVIAEDLGIITDDVRAVMNHFNFPGMKILVFAFGGNNIAENAYIPHNHIKNSVIYTGTHDTNTVRGWFEKDASLEEKENLAAYKGRPIRATEISWEFISMSMSSVANTVILPMQDILSLPHTCRMNLPSTKKGNWLWRLKPDQITTNDTKRLASITRATGRATD